MTWLVVHCKARSEDLAQENLRRQGYEVFLPQLRQRKRRQNRWQWVTGPLFPRYLFVNVALGEQDTATIRSTVGVVTLVRFGQALVPMPDAVIDYLRRCEDPALGARSDSDWPHRPGDVVEILQGPFAGLTGIYQVPKDADRAAILVDLLGRRNTVLVEREALGDVVTPATA
ncbi:transcription termination/antitermination protein NusG [Pseudohaliea rubra]|uniref:NusG-like N-terminal domain-containing protein n=1 Tax=Pseudohaliea rubra DSM 19751 TaxID=1265313 RepID=A0A095VMX3_9GAMM|nr:transcriptional activator RfaH [Pseudohaliea rubra]KGE02827.1 hypothetical protein HRUBRA_02608 [Pseudohaliea rubra DSM 19751]